MSRDRAEFGAVGDVGEFHDQSLAQIVDLQGIDRVAAKDDPRRDRDAGTGEQAHRVGEPDDRPGLGVDEGWGCRREGRRRVGEHAAERVGDEPVVGIDGAIQRFDAPGERQALSPPLVDPRPGAGGLDWRDDEWDIGVQCRGGGERGEQGAAPSFVARPGPPGQAEQVDGRRVLVEDLDHQLGLGHHEPGEIEWIDGVAGHPLADPRFQFGERRKRRADLVGQVGGEGRDPAGGGDHPDSPDRSSPGRRELGEELGAVEQIVDVAGGDDAVLAERQVVDPRRVGDRPGVRLHDVAGTVGPAELEGDHRLALLPGIGDRLKELVGATDGLDDQADHAGLRTVGEDRDVVGKVADRFVPRRDPDRDPELPLAGGGECGAHQEARLRHDRHPTRRQVESTAGEQVDAERNVLEPAAVRPDDRHATVVGGLLEPSLQRGSRVAGLHESGR